MTPKRILFLLRRPPYQSSHAIEAIEAILVAGVFDQTVSVVFKDDGVWQLVKNQDGAKLGTRTLGKVLGALSEYGVERLFVCATSLELRGLTDKDLAVAAEPINHPQLRELIAQQHAVLND